MRKFFNGLFPCAPPLLCFFGELPTMELSRGAACAPVPGRLPEASLISNSLSSSHCASVRSLSGMERRACRRWCGEIPCGPSFMLALSHAPHAMTGHDSIFRASRTHASAAATSLRLAPCILPRLSRTSSEATRACCSIQRRPRRTRTPGAEMVNSFLAIVALESTGCEEDYRKH